MVDWQRFGFVHGVMNTDNLSITGLTIDYGPYGWLDDYNPEWTPNTTDAGTRRYRYGQQPAVAHWNLAQLANALYPLIEDLEPLQQAIDRAEAGDFSEVLNLQRLLRNPFEEQCDCEAYAAKRPDWARMRVGCSQLSCSS